MLDRIDPGAQCVIDPRHAMGMSGDAQAEHMGFGDDRLHFLELSCCAPENRCARARRRSRRS